MPIHPPPTVTIVPTPSFTVDPSIFTIPPATINQIIIGCQCDATFLSANDALLNVLNAPRREAHYEVHHIICPILLLLDHLRLLNHKHHHLRRHHLRSYQCNDGPSLVPHTLDLGFIPLNNLISILHLLILYLGALIHLRTLLLSVVSAPLVFILPNPILLHGVLLLILLRLLQTIAPPIHCHIKLSLLIFLHSFRLWLLLPLLLLLLLILLLIFLEFLARRCHPWYLASLQAHLRASHPVKHPRRPLPHHIIHLLLINQIFGLVFLLEIQERVCDQHQRINNFLSPHQLAP